MSNLDVIDQLFQRFEALFLEDPTLRAEFEASATEFFLAGWNPRRYAGDDLARRRHLEWFLLERLRPGAARLAIESLTEVRPELADLIGTAELQAFLNSHTSVFEVTGVDPGQGVWMRDMTGHGEYPVAERQASTILQRGDLIAGRIFPVGDGVHRISRAAAFIRNSKLLEALRGDLERAREGRRSVLRVSQSEIERMFFGADFVRSADSAVGDARALLLAGGIESERVDAWLAELTTTPFDTADPLPATHAIVSGILDELAFDTAIDLDAARATLIRAWAELSARGAGQGVSLRPRAKPVDVSEVVAQFETKRKNGKPLVEILTELEDQLALVDDGGDADESAELDSSADADPDEDADSVAPDFPGVVGAMIEEFLWEASLASGPGRATELAPLRSLGRFTETIGVFENLGASDLLKYTCFWLPEGGELANGEAARALLSALQSFCRWAEDEHAVALHTQFKDTLATLSSSLPRTIEANRRRTRSSDRSQGELFEVIAIDAERGQARIGARNGDGRHATIDVHLAEWLRAGDRLRAHLHSDGRLAVYCCYPPESRALEGE